MSEMIDGYTASKMKEFWEIGNLSSGLSPYVIQGQADKLLKEISELKSRLSHLSAVNEKLREFVLKCCDCDGEHEDICDAHQLLNLVDEMGELK